MSRNNSKANKVHPPIKEKEMARDVIEISGKMLYRKIDDDAIEVEEVYEEPNVPGKYAGDC